MSHYEDIVPPFLRRPLAGCQNAKKALIMVEEARLEPTLEVAAVTTIYLDDTGLC